MSFKSREDENNYEVIDLNNLPSLLSAEDFTDENGSNTMTSLNALLLLSYSEAKCSDCKGENQFRLSLAYENLSRIPNVILNCMAQQIRILDLSYNNFDNLNFLSEFKNLETFICDHNKITSNTYIPFMPKLRFLWLNYCKINGLYPWAKRLQNSCPNLLHLSLMGNPAAPSYLNGGSVQEYLEYRYFVISLFPNLIYLDDRGITKEQREEAQKIYNRPILERMAIKNSTAMPNCLKAITDRITALCSPVPPFAVPQKNTII
ncbi:uncharacterized protein LOC108734360 [Agrilus planipennis]|uniref:Uncharacterized protein LOC108734360 n=1 Tax=Agrilus planipennis TaxID=224129 RepID=A0A1W4WBN2_AGRPL|nr:uncharacterized protein LOC108734360 [Agrilus planipennis]